MLPRVHRSRPGRYYSRFNFRHLLATTNETKNNTASKCMPPPQKCIWFRHDLQLWPLTFKTFSAIPTRMINICPSPLFTITVENRVRKPGRRSRGGTRGISLPQKNWSEDANANCPPSDFCHTGTKRSVLWPTKYAKIRFRPGLCREPRWGSSQRSPRPPSQLELPIPHPTRHRPTFGARHVSPRIPASYTPM